MKRFFTLTLSLLALGFVSASAVTRSDGNTLPTKRSLQPISVPGHRIAAQNMVTTTADASQNNTHALRRVSEFNPKQTLTAPGFGYLKGPDGTQWYYTQSYELRGSGYSASYGSSTIKLYDSNNQAAGEVKVEIPSDLNVNYIAVDGDVTQKLFDRTDTSNEIAVLFHIVGSADNNYEGAYKIYVYHTTGEKIMEFDTYGMMFNMSQGWNGYQRQIMMRSGVESDGSAMTYYDILTTPDYGTNKMKVEHTFAVADSLTYYSEGASLNCYELDGEPYYVISYYEKDWVESIGDDFYPVQREDNNYIVKVYDRKYNLVDSIAAPVIKPDDATYRMAAFGFMSDKDLSSGYFTAKGEHALVVSFYDMTIESDSYLYSFEVYNSKGEKINTVCTNAVSGAWQTLSPVNGMSDQMAFLQTIGDTQQIHIVDLPTCATALVIPAEIDGQSISFNLDRYPKGKSCIYGIKKATADTDDDGNVIASILWYTPELELDHVAKFNLGQNGEYFTPLLASTTMNPYLFDSDDELEYIYIAKKKRDDSNVIDNVLEVANEDGTVIRTFRGNDDYALRTPSVVKMSSTINQLHIAYYNDDTDEYLIDYYDLPLVGNELKGEGTAESPYLIATAGDLLQIGKHTDAYYRLTDNIDMDLLTQGWTPIENFTGTLDGAGHTITNLNISGSDSRVGLFAMINEGGTVKNLTIADATLTLTSSNAYAGFIAGETMQATIDSVHVVYSTIASPSDSYDAVIGGLVGRATYYTDATRSSFSGTIDAAGANSVGGIYGASRTSSDVIACMASGDITANTLVGGIVGETDRDCNVVDCHANVDIMAHNTIGGIVGENDSRGKISRCIAEGSITATESSRWYGWSVAGVVGNLMGDEAVSGVEVVSGNVVNVAIELAADGTADGTVHRIAGYTTINESYESDETPKIDPGLKFNYALASMSMPEGAVTCDEDTCTDGKTIKAEDLTRDFYTTLKYAFGVTTDAPWKYVDSKALLYYEDEVMAVVFDDKPLYVNQGESLTTTVTVYGGKADGLALSVADENIATAEISSTASDVATITIKALKEGSTTLTLTLGDFTTEATLTVRPALTNAISAPDVVQTEISINGNAVTAVGASRMAIYSITGQCLAATHRTMLSTMQLPAGVYVAVAIDANGKIKSKKFIVK